jgi:hypothetical protein
MRCESKLPGERGREFSGSKTTTPEGGGIYNEGMRVFV